MNILLVEDDVGSRKSMKQFIGSLGHTVFESENGREALDILGRGHIHTVLSDIRMPVMDGHELLRRIKADDAHRDTVVILFTAFKDVNSAIEALRDGAYDYLLKPINPEELAVILSRIGEYLTLKNENTQLTEHFDRAVEKVTRDLENELLELRKAFAREVGTSEIGLFSDVIRAVFKTADKLHHNRDIPVLIEGETGTGKEIVARYIHYGSGDVTTTFVGINCAAISPELFESELFGYESGAFTGSRAEGQKGKIELAEGGTLFLDEITQLNTEYQAKLLRVLQEHEFYRVGGVKKIKTDVRIVCATNEDIQNRVADGSFRQDLYYRLNIGRVYIPPLRKRKDEIIPLVRLFLNRLAAEKKTRFISIDPRAAEILMNYPWPGNVRELSNTVERVVFLHDDVTVRAEHLDFLLRESVNVPQNASVPLPQSGKDISLPASGIDLDGWVLDIVKRALELNDGNKSETARYLGISRRSMYTYLKHLESRS